MEDLPPRAGRFHYRREGVSSPGKAKAKEAAIEVADHYIHDEKQETPAEQTSQNGGAAEREAVATLQLAALGSGSTSACEFLDGCNPLGM